LDTEEIALVGTTGGKFDSVALSWVLGSVNMEYLLEILDIEIE
jgi:hypothetical protein